MAAPSTSQRLVATTPTPSLATTDPLTPALSFEAWLIRSSPSLSKSIADSKMEVVPPASNGVAFLVSTRTKRFFMASNCGALEPFARPPENGPALVSGGAHDGNCCLGGAVKEKRQGYIEHQVTLTNILRKTTTSTGVTNASGPRLRR